MKNKFKFALIIFMLLAGLFAEYRGVSLNTDNTIAFQGYLTDASGRPYFGSVYIDFVFYDTEFPTDNVTANNDHRIIPTSNNLSYMNRKVAVYNGQYATKLALPNIVMSQINANKDVWVEVYVNRSSDTNVITTENVMLPRVQLNAATYALAVKGLYYYEGNNNNVLKIGKGFQDKQPVSANNGLIVSGNVGIGTSDAALARLVISRDDTPNSAKNMYVQGSVTVNGSISAPKYSDIIRDNDNDWGVWNAVWN